MQYKPWVKRVVETVSEVFNLSSEWRVEVTWTTDYPDNDHSIVMSMHTDSDYLKTWMYITPRAKEIWDEGRLDILVECVVHEFVHVITDPVYQFAKSASSEITFPFLTTKNEQTTQRLTRVVTALLPKKIFSLR